MTRNGYALDSSWKMIQKYFKEFPEELELGGLYDDFKFGEIGRVIENMALLIQIEDPINETSTMKYLLGEFGSSGQDAVMYIILARGEGRTDKQSRTIIREMLSTFVQKV